MFRAHSLGLRTELFSRDLHFIGVDSRLKRFSELCQLLFAESFSLGGMNEYKQQLCLFYRLVNLSFYSLLFFFRHFGAIFS